MSLRSKAFHCLVFVVFLSLSSVSAPPSGNAGEKLTVPLVTNEDYIDKVTASFNVDTSDLMTMFRIVFFSLPERVKVYPTENYYYFRLARDGNQFAGNFRLDALDRDRGIIHFAYFRDYEPWLIEDNLQHKALTSKDGVKVEKVEDLVYAVTYAGRRVIFALNDLRGVKPPQDILGENETYIGPIFDESGIRFVLIFNRLSNVFHYGLDETVKVADVFRTSSVSDRIVVGQRTGFAFYEDRLKKRRILIGVHAANTDVNNWFDGPFDQLPDNFLKGNALRDAIVATSPQLANTIDRFGNYDKEGSERVFIAPYIHWRYEDELAVFSDCARDLGLSEKEYYSCFAISPEDDHAESAGAEDMGSEDKSATIPATAAK
ncbi:MAG TPA: hypothetical protein ENJ26_00630 [Rhodobacteraceae bacterium]|nr:hypothetical protein [Paracoccaceae bacterium]